MPKRRVLLYSESCYVSYGGGIVDAELCNVKITLNLTPSLRAAIQKQLPAPRLEAWWIRQAIEEKLARERGKGKKKGK